MNWYTGSNITGTSGTPAVFANSEVVEAASGDFYLNIDVDADYLGNVYQCADGGVPSVATWFYVTRIRGATGPQGIRGIQGIPGTSGVTPIITINTVTTLSPGNDATVEIDASSTAAEIKLNIGIPRGSDATGDMLSALYDPQHKGTDAFDSANHKYDNTTSELDATTVQAALDKLSTLVGATLFPKLVVTSVGATCVSVVAVCGTDSVSLVNTVGTGIWAGNLPHFGTWVVTGTDTGSNTYAVSVVVDATKVYDARIFPPYAVTAGVPAAFSENTWDQIIAACNANWIPDNWKSGDMKAMTIGGVDYFAQIIEKYHDELYTGGAKVPLTIAVGKAFDGIDAASAGMLATKLKMNTSSTATNYYASSHGRTTLLGTIFDSLPTNVKNNIKAVRKKTSAGNLSGAITESSETLFFLSEVEVFGNVYNSVSGEGEQYEFFAKGVRQKRYKGGVATAYNLRSPSTVSKYFFCNVSSSGAPAYGYPNLELGVVACLCL